MNNPLFQQYMNRDFLTQFNQFRKSFNGNPQQAVQQLLNSGKITQEQYNQAVQMANQFNKMIGR